MTGIVLAVVRPGDLAAARAQMGFSLAWHIVLACLGVGLPLLTVLAEWRGIRTGDQSYRLLARRWARAMGVLFAVGAVSGTILSFEMGLLWPGLMGTFGQVIGLPFAMEGIAFFIEAIFLGIYLYAWDRLEPRKHVLTGLPIIVAGIASAFFVVCANAWMNQPRGFTLQDGRVTAVQPWAAMFNPAAPPQTVHMILAAVMVACFLTASVYAVALLRGRRDRYHRLGFFLPLTIGAVVTPVQIVVGDWAARFVANYQPTKLAAMEGVYHTGTHVPLTIGGIAQGDRLRYGLEIPDGLSLLVGYSPDTEIRGLDQVPRDRWPPVTGVHLAFDLMVGVGFFLLLVAVWLAVGAFLRRRRGRFLLPRAFWVFGLVAGPAAVVALEAGWTVTEEGRQPWIVQGVMSVRDAVNPAPGLMVGLWLVLVVYAGMTVGVVYVLRRLAKQTPVPVAPQERDVEDYPVT
ncbi:cytochrome ubiquinol oxidase subunit I [Amycolatopsis acidiphila]|uniref:cytochrome ubiquinol oxidase subunit I n=1 Tax=Amycolatopsis acidiphila TaxID=715473 RepID=UPI0019BBD8B7|nr:cytochrome ubiquinol oxidase subunit I [Amycolatopsis acidiphila]UIJ61704.1 cytochrome ubiquinol oxidase subunit I [Amycolatopsis acidiphila]GHG58316.1 cytochrome ubiquinol oxidase subunit I [Amycolatopsis acidiphila]